VKAWNLLPKEWKVGTSVCLKEGKVGQIKEKGELTTTTFRTPMVLDFIINDHPDCIVGIGWETCTSNVTFGELSSVSSLEL